MSYEANKSIDKIIELAKAILNIEVDLVKNLQNYIKHYLYKHGDRGKPSKETMEEWHNDPSNWKWGFIYFNKKDKRVLVPKRQMLLGWTVNLASPYSLLVLLATIALIVYLRNS